MQKNTQQGQKHAELSKSIEGKLLTATQKVQKDQCLQKERESKEKIWSNDQMMYQNFDSFCFSR